jgi:anaerobic magnesium-protoporphyrin IX monomethyl ester cyclase
MSLCNSISLIIKKSIIEWKFYHNYMMVYHHAMLDYGLLLYYFLFMVVLINPGFEVSYQPPLGLAYIAAYLKQSGYSDVIIIDTAFDNLRKRLQNIKTPLVFGIYIMTPYVKRAYETISYLKRIYPNVPFVAGGPHPTIQPEHTIRNSGADMCVRGEGEYTFHEVVKAVYNKESMDTIKGISYVNDSDHTIRHNPSRAPITHLDALPFPARELLPMYHYLRGGSQKAFSYNNIRATTMIVSRGCPFQCTFCQPTIDEIFGRRVRYRSVDNVMDELLLLKKTYDIGGIFFLDDIFTSNKVMVHRFCEEVIRKNLNLRFAINSRIDTINNEILPLLKKAGVVTIMYGIESGNQKVLDAIKKKITVDQIKKAITLTKKYGIHVYGYFMLGSPEESLSSIKDTYSLVRSLPFDEVQFSIATPYVGTYLYNEACKDNLIINPSAMEREGYFSSISMRSHYLDGHTIQRYHRYFSLYSRLKSIKNIVLNHPHAILPLLTNRIFSQHRCKTRQLHLSPGKGIGER